jgi:hypothetical protein
VNFKSNSCFSMPVPRLLKKFIASQRYPSEFLGRPYTAAGRLLRANSK